MEHYRVPQPHKSPSAARQNELIDLFINEATAITELWRQSLSPYLGWDKFSAKFKSGIIGKHKALQNITAEEAWFILTMRRKFSQENSKIQTVNGGYFGWSKNMYIERMLHDFAMKLGGNLITDTLSGGKSRKDRFLRQSLVEEAIASSQLEGAATTRQSAKKMLVENTKPRNHDEWMIFNNYQTIRKIESETSRYPLSREVLLDLHILMTKNSLDEDKIGRWRTDADEIIVKRQIANEEMIVHVPPRDKELQKEIDKLIDFANDKDDEDEYLDPVVKAIMIHFWFAYIHPFCDGNGRLARSLFYWYLMRHGYWLISYVPISTVLRRAAGSYADSFVYSEQYMDDLSYFVDFNLSKLQLALKMFDDHVKNVRDKAATIDTLLPRHTDFNDRQKQVLYHLLGKSGDEITAQRHADFHEVSWITASQDLKQLVVAGYLSQSKIGREVLYSGTDQLYSLAVDVND